MKAWTARDVALIAVLLVTLALAGIAAWKGDRVEAKIGGVATKVDLSSPIKVIHSMAQVDYREELVTKSGRSITIRTYRKEIREGDPPVIRWQTNAELDAAHDDAVTTWKNAH